VISVSFVYVYLAKMVIVTCRNCAGFYMREHLFILLQTLCILCLCFASSVDFCELLQSLHVMMMFLLFTVAANLELITNTK